MGLVWGWLAGSAGSRLLRPGQMVPAASASVAVIAAEVFLIQGSPEVAAFLAATGAALLVHAGWRHRLRAGLPETGAQGG